MIRSLSSLTSSSLFLSFATARINVQRWCLNRDFIVAFIITFVLLVMIFYEENNVVHSFSIQPYNIYHDSRRRGYLYHNTYQRCACDNRKQYSYFQLNSNIKLWKKTIGESILKMTSSSLSSSSTDLLLSTNIERSISNISQIPIPIVNTVAITGGTHGNEYTGVWIVRSILENEYMKERMKLLYPSLNIMALISNPIAHSNNRRFINIDLNRLFTTQNLEQQHQQQSSTITATENDIHNTIEGKRCYELNDLLGPKLCSNDTNVDLIIDLHTTTSNMGITLIIPEGDILMTQAAAYVMYRCNILYNNKANNKIKKQDNNNSNENNNNQNPFIDTKDNNHNHIHNNIQFETRILMHPAPDRTTRPNLSSVAKHGFTIEVGPVPQGLLRHDAIIKTQSALHFLLEFIENYNNINNIQSTTIPSNNDNINIPIIHGNNEKNNNNNNQIDNDKEQQILQNETRNNFVEWMIQNVYMNYSVPCYRSARAKNGSGNLGKITWPSHPDNPNFPLYMIHESLQDRDFEIVRTGDPLFVSLYGNEIIYYDGSYGDIVHLIFINEGGYYYASSGTGIGVAVQAQYHIIDGTFL